MILIFHTITCFEQTVKKNVRFAWAHSGLEASFEIEFKLRDEVMDTFEEADNDWKKRTDIGWASP